MLAPLHKETAAILGVAPGARASTPLGFATMVRKGLPTKAVHNVVVRVSAGYPDDADSLRSFIVSAGTYKRRLAQGRLSPEESEKAVRFARLMATAEHVLGDADEARHFLHEPHAELEGRKPVEVAETEIGAREVEALLWKAFYGVPA